MKLLTWNVWFGGYRLEERADALITEILRLAPDVAALQEVTPDLLSILTSHARLSATYQLSDTQGRTVDPYGVLLLSRGPMQNPSWVPLPSQMGRTLLCAERADGLSIATAHLESTKHCAEQRAEQLTIIMGHLAKLDGDVVFCGDMNFTPAAPLENGALDPDFVDIWPHLMGDDPGYTIDTDINTMRLAMKGKRARKRIDRIFLRAKQWRATEVSVVGTEAFDPIDVAFVSDHFGLSATLQRG